MAIIQHLIVDQYGAFVGKHSQRLQVKVKGEKVMQAPLLHLEQVLITGRGVSLSADAIQACCQEGIPIHFVSTSGQPYAGLYAAGLTGTVQTRRAQIMAYEDDRGLALAMAFASGKVENQSRLLKYMAKYRKEADPSLYEELRLAAQEVLDHLEELRRLRAERVDEVRLQILAAEGRAAHRYWEALKLVVPEQYGWPGRRRRGAKDPLNAALNYGYGILYGQIERAVVLAGLDPYGGFIHADRPGKPSLVLDLIEEFRAPVVDRTVLGLANKRTQLAQDEKGLLTLETRRLLAERVLARLEAAERYERKRQPLRIIIQSQARHIATFVRGDRAQYKPFLARW
ncbi:MAG: CRISPR-associated endonuclease Cas1 [Anaerolineae bacterium]